MSKEKRFYIFQNTHLHYRKAGRGNEVLLAFHGYGQENTHFLSLEYEIGEQYQIFAFDLFYHGSSFWHSNDQPLTKEYWCELIEGFLKENQIERFSLLGFSMGAKFALSTLEKFPHKVNEIILIAPDGIKSNFWYNVATYPVFFRKYFRSMVLRPQGYFNLVQIMGKLRLIDKSVVRFANSQMRTREQRRRVYYSWMIFRKLKFDINYIGALINRYNILLTMFLGKYDKMITLRNVNKLLKKVKSVEVHLMEAGHSNLIAATAKYYKEKFKNQ